MNKITFSSLYHRQFICSSCSNYLKPLRKFSFSFVDDLSVCSDNWTRHMSHLRVFLTEIRNSFLILNVKKCSFVKPEVECIGHVIGWSTSSG